MATSPPWRWTSDGFPDDEQEVWIRTFDRANKPFLATWHEATQLWGTSIGGVDYALLWFVVIQWRAQDP
jgi:hypothetical protein